MKGNGIEAFVVTNGKLASFRNNQEMQNAIIKAGIKIYVQRNEEEWKDSGIDKPALKHIEIEDLLPREEIQIDMDAVGTLLRGKSIMITGSAGSIGSEIVRQVAKFEPEMMLLIDQAETPQHDIRLFMQRIIHTSRPKP